MRSVRAENKNVTRSSNKARVGSLGSKGTKEEGTRVEKTRQELKKKKPAKPEEDRRLNPDAKEFAPATIPFTLNANAGRFVPR